MVRHGDAFNVMRCIVLHAQGPAGLAMATSHAPLMPVLNRGVRTSPLHSQDGPPSLHPNEARGSLAVLCDTCLKRLVLTVDCNSLGIHGPGPHPAQWACTYLNLEYKKGPGQGRWCLGMGSVSFGS